MSMQSSKERGAILIMTLVYSVVLIGVAALALDIGRLFLLHSEMQNAADAAALAAAAELDGESGARDRARTAARELLSHKGRFALKQDLLNEEALPSETAFTFYCAIGSEYDLTPEASCSSANVNEPYYEASSDSDAHYVKVTLQDSGGEDDFYVIDLLFFPVLSLITDDPTILASSKNEATAGRHDLICNYPPLMMCDPFESSGGLRNNVSAGQQIQMKLQKDEEHGGGSWWAPGDFAFLEPRCDPTNSKCQSGGAMDLADYIADEQLQICTPMIVTSKTGQNTGPTIWAMNTRFDFYESHHYPVDEYPPAPNVVDYPRDDDFDNRIGDGDWNRTDYWNNFHPTDAQPSGYSSMTRWEVYNWEVEQDKIPCYDGYEFRDKKGDLLGTLNCALDDPSASIPSKAEEFPSEVDGKPDPTHVYTGDYPPPRSVAERRLLHMAVLSCQALGINGKETVPVENPDGFARIFVTEHMGIGGGEDANIFGEYIGWSDKEDEDYHVEIQLYE